MTRNANSVLVTPIYNRSACLFHIDAEICGMSFRIATDSQDFLAGIRRVFLGDAFQATSGKPSEFTCYCATRCTPPWHLAIETPNGIHLARPHAEQNARFDFFEYKAEGEFHPVGHSQFSASSSQVDGNTDSLILVDYVRRRLMRSLINRPETAAMHILHASSLQIDGKGLLILGDSRSGKSTLALAAALDGCGYLAEEHSAIDLEQGMLHPYPMPFRVRTGTLSLIPALASLPREAIADMSGEMRWIIDPCQIARIRIGTTAPLTHLIHLAPRANHATLTPARTSTLLEACLKAEVFPASGDPLLLYQQWSERLSGVKNAILAPGPPDETIALLKQWMQNG